MSNIKDISVSDRLNQRNTWATLEDMQRYCSCMSDMLEDFISEIEFIQDENEKLKKELEELESENEELKEEVNDLKLVLGD